MTDVGLRVGGVLNREEALRRRSDIALVFTLDSSSNVCAKKSVSSLKLRTLSSMRPNCLLIRRVRGVISRGRNNLGRLEINLSACLYPELRIRLRKLIQ